MLLGRDLNAIIEPPVLAKYARQLFRSENTLASVSELVGNSYFYFPLTTLEAT